MNEKLREADSTKITQLTDRQARFVRSRMAKAFGVITYRRRYAPEVETVTDFTPAMRHLSGFVEQKLGRGTIFYRSTSLARHPSFNISYHVRYMVLVYLEAGWGFKRIADHEMPHASMS